MKFKRQKTIGKYTLLVTQYNDGDYELAIFRNNVEKGFIGRDVFPNERIAVMNIYRNLNTVGKVEKYIFNRKW